MRRRYKDAAEQLRTIAFLVEECGANVNCRDEEGFTPLAAAARAGYRDIVEYLIAKGAKTEWRNPSPSLIGADTPRSPLCSGSTARRGERDRPGRWVRRLAEPFVRPIPFAEWVIHTVRTRRRDAGGSGRETALPFLNSIAKVGSVSARRTLRTRARTTLWSLAGLCRHFAQFRSARRGRGFQQAQQFHPLMPSPVSCRARADGPRSRTRNLNRRRRKSPTFTFPPARIDSLSPMRWDLRSATRLKSADP